MPVFLFFHSIGPNLAQILSQRPHPLYFFWLLSSEMLGDSININNLCCNSLVLKKKLVKPLRNCFFGTTLHKRAVIMGHTQNEKQFFLAEITKADHQLSETFYFIKISCFDKRIQYW